MRIDTKNKIIYLANPKTGSTSLRKTIDKKSNWDLMNYLKENNKYHDHWCFEQYKLIFNELSEVNNKISVNLDEYFSFTTIRNPWRRVVSGYKYQKCDKQGCPWYITQEFGYHWYHDKTTAGEFSFSDYIKRINKEDCWCKCGMPNAEWFCFDKNNNQLVTKIYKIETLTSDKINNDIKKHLGIDYNLEEIPVLNTTKKDDYKKYYTEQWMIDKVGEVYKKDIELGNYTFE